MKEAHDKASSKSKLNLKNRNLMIVIAVVITGLVFWLIQQTGPERSVAAYCKVYGQEKARLSAMSNNSYPYPSGLFDVSVTDAAQIATSLGKLSPVAPNEIEPMITNLQKLYQDIHDNPSHAISNALNGGSLDDSLKAWTQQHCQGDMRN